MNRLRIALLGAAIGAGVVAATTPAAAFWPLLIAVALGASAGGLIAGSAIATGNPPPARIATSTAGPDWFPPPWTAYGSPMPAPIRRCAASRRFARGAWRGAEICD